MMWLLSIVCTPLRRNAVFAHDELVVKRFCSSSANFLSRPLGMPRRAMFRLCEIPGQMSARNVRTFTLAQRFVMCEQWGMERPTTMELAGKAGISKSYASEILSGREPRRPLAIHIMRTTGWRHPVIAGLSDEQISVLESIEPWTPRAA